MKMNDWMSMSKSCALVLILLFLSSLVTIQQTTVKAQSKTIIVPVDIITITGEVPPDSETFPPQISVLTPTNNTVYAVNILPLVFNISAPQSTTASSTIVQYVGYTADWMDKTVDVFGGGEKQVDLSLQFSNVPEGNHSIIIQALGSGLYAEVLGYKEFRISSSLEIKFMIDTIVPTVSIQPIGNVSSEEGIPLIFAVNEPVSRISYVLDKQQNITVQGNTTLSYLPDGEHNITVFACDFAGNIGKSESTFFVVQQPAIKPESFPIINIAIIIVVIMLMTTTFYLLFRRHRKASSFKL